MTSIAWQPLFSGRAAVPFEAVIDRIVVELDSHPVSSLDWGQPLLHTYLGEARASDAHRARAIQLVDGALDAMAESVQLPSLYGGFAGLGWLSAHTDPLFGRHDDAAYEEMDEALVSYTGAPASALYDLIGGLVGIGVYFIERLPSRAAQHGLACIVEQLVARAEASGDSVTWLTPPECLVDWHRETAPAGYYNLGVAHGVPGIVAFLAEMRRARIGDADLDDLLRRACRWVLDLRRDRGFPAWIQRGSDPAITRLAWCYGALGISVALLQAGRALGDAAIEASAIDIALESARRRDDGGAVDACMCHGSAGIGHLFNRLFQATRHTEFRDAAIFWFNRALEMRIEGQGVAGYTPRKTQDLPSDLAEDPAKATSFLSGAAGIGLALLAATSTVAPNWDRVLLARLEPGPPGGL